MDSTQASQWLVRIFATQELEIDCPTSADSLPQFVDLLVRGLDASRFLPRVWLHIQQCPNCCDLFECLQDVVLLEGRADLPRPDFSALFRD